MINVSTHSVLIFYMCVVLNVIKIPLLPRKHPSLAQDDLDIQAHRRTTLEPLIHLLDVQDDLDVWRTHVIGSNTYSLDPGRYGEPRLRIRQMISTSICEGIQVFDIEEYNMT